MHLMDGWIILSSAFPNVSEVLSFSSHLNLCMNYIGSCSRHLLLTLLNVCQYTKFVGYAFFLPSMLTAFFGVFYTNYLSSC